MTKSQKQYWKAEQMELSMVTPSVLDLGGRMVACESIPIGPGIKSVKRVCGHLHKTIEAAMRCAKQKWKTSTK